MKHCATIILFFLTSQIYSFTPGKWSHMDRYVLGLEKFGPSTEIVKNQEGKITYTAEYEYDSSGKLTKEKYSDKDGKSDGETMFFYENGKVSKEELYSSDKALKESKKYKYGPGGELKEIELYSGDGKAILKCKINSIDNGLVSDAETIWYVSQETESFSLKKDLKAESVLNQEIYDNKKKLTAEIKYSFDKLGNLQTRENFQGNQLRLNRLNYNVSGKLENFSFHVKQGDKWNLVKTHYLIYRNGSPVQNTLKN
ncbi:MAG: hypothetical protein K8R21_07200 [Leptospira sp.]|nr:hypothetical protein [Leptospira sp.]